ncbi:MAG: phage protein GemA/Gp16 family protein [Paracoccaceae bacterium]
MTPRARQLQRTIHAASREIGIADDDRRALQLAATGKASTADMTEADLRGVIDALKARGWTPKGGRGRPKSPRADIRFIHVLWRLLAMEGHVTSGREALNAFIRRSFGDKWATLLDVDMMRDPDQIAAVTEALKAMCRRHGVEVARARRGPGS